MTLTRIIYDFILVFIIAALYLWLYLAVVEIVRKRRKASKGNPFRRFKDHELRSILTKL